MASLGGNLLIPPRNALKKPAQQAKAKEIIATATMWLDVALEADLENVIKQAQEQLDAKRVVKKTSGKTIFKASAVKSTYLFFTYCVSHIFISRGNLRHTS